MKEFPILILAGYSAVGKSTIGPALCEKCGFHYINHQKLLHGLAEARGYKRSRYWLADVGIQSFIEESLNEMVRKIKDEEDKARGFLIDAAYGNQMLEKFEKAFPDAKVVVIAVLADPEIREGRIMGRMAAEREPAIVEMQFRDGFLREAGLDEVLRQTDFAVYNTGELKETVNTISGFLALRGIKPT